MFNHFFKKKILECHLCFEEGAITKTVIITVCCGWLEAFALEATVSKWIIFFVGDMMQQLALGREYWGLSGNKGTSFLPNTDSSLSNRRHILFLGIPWASVLRQYCVSTVLLPCQSRHHAVQWICKCSSCQSVLLCSKGPVCLVLIIIKHIITYSTLKSVRLSLALYENKL